MILTNCLNVYPEYMTPVDSQNFSLLEVQADYMWMRNKNGILRLLS